MKLSRESIIAEIILLMLSGTCLYVSFLFFEHGWNLTGWDMTVNYIVGVYFFIPACLPIPKIRKQFEKGVCKNGI